MNITMIESPPNTSTPASDLMAKLELLDDDEKLILHDLSMTFVDTLISKTGTLVMMSDVKGNGMSRIVAVGNPALVPLLLAAAGEAGQAMFSKPEQERIQ